MSDADLNSETRPPSEDILERLERLAVRIPSEIRDRDAETLLRLADEAAKAATADIALLEQVAEYAAFVGESIDANESSRLKDDFRALTCSGVVIAKVAAVGALNDAIEELRSLSGSVKLVERPIAQAWQQHVESTFNTAGSLGNVLHRIPETRELGTAFSMLQQDATALKMRRGTAKELASKFEVLEERLKVLRSELSGIGAGREIINFLEAVSHRRATLALLTREVRNWLKERNALDLFHVTL